MGGATGERAWRVYQITENNVPGPIIYVDLRPMLTNRFLFTTAFLSNQEIYTQLQPDIQFIIDSLYIPQVAANPHTLTELRVEQRTGQLDRSAVEKSPAPVVDERP